MTITQRSMSHRKQDNNDVNEGPPFKKRYSTRSAGSDKRGQNCPNIDEITEFLADDQHHCAYYSNDKGSDGAVNNLDQNGPFQNAHQRQSANARERSRTFHVNAAFNALRTLIPTKPPNRKLSKIETLHLAISYISHLSTLLIEDSEDIPGYDHSPKAGPQITNALFEEFYPHSDYIMQPEPHTILREQNYDLNTNLNEDSLVGAPKLSRALESKYCTFCAFHNPTPSSLS